MQNTGVSLLSKSTTMKKFLFLFYLILSTGTLFSQNQYVYRPDANNTLYVNQNAQWHLDGSSWEKPAKYLADVLKWAATSGNYYGSSSPLKIYVAVGTYSPEFNAADFSRNNTEDFAFNMVSNVHLYGGFDPANGRTLLSQRRNYEQTILQATSNMRHVLVAVSRNGIVVDGFNIKGGNATGSGSLDINGENVSRDHGGALNIDKAKMIIRNCIITGNSAKTRGGAIYATGSGVGDTDLTLINTVLYRNSSGSHGSAVSVNSDAKVKIINCTVASNNSSADSFGGAIDTNGGGSQDINIYNTIIYNNLRKTTLVNISGGASKFKNIRNIIYNGSWDSAYNSATTNNYNTDPKFVDLSAGNFRLNTTSAAINVGNNTYYTDPNLANGNLSPGMDLAGISRLVGSKIDIGAYENQVLPLAPTNRILYVKKGGTGDGSSWANAVGELADALKWAKQVDNFTTANPLQIWVAKGTYLPKYSPINGDNLWQAADARNYTFLMVNNVQLYGGFAGTETTLSQRNLSLSGNASYLSGDDGVLYSNANNFYHVVVSSGNVGNASLNGFTVRDGNANGLSGKLINGNYVNQNAGGGIVNVSSAPAITNVFISYNFASVNGGGMHNVSSSPKLNYVEITGNIASSGGGMYNISSSPIITNVKINQNKATTAAGMKNDNGSSPVLTNVTISKNHSSSKYGGILNDASSPKLYNTIVWGNTETSGHNQVASNIGNFFSTPNYVNCLIEGSKPNNVWNATFGTDGGINIDVNPLFVDYENDDYNLSALSPASNKGSNNLYTTNGGNLNNDKDLAGNPRLIDTSIDIGAYENKTILIVANPTNNILYVNKNVVGGNGSGSSWANAMKELADALKWAKQQDNFSSANSLQIWVAGGTYKPMYRPDTFIEPNNTDKNNTFLMVNNVQLYGGFAGTESSLSQRNLNQTANASILSGDLNGNDEIQESLNIGATPVYNIQENAYHVLVSSGEIGTAVLNGFTVQGGYAAESIGYKIMVNSNAIVGSHGGGIFNRSSLVISQVKFQYNRANSYGGGMHSEFSAPIISHVSFSNNISEANGGGISNSSSTPTLKNITINNNTAFASGGGVYNDYSSPVLTNVVINNNAGGNAGGMINFGGTPILVNVSISNNRTSQEDITKSNGGLYNLNSSPKLFNSIVWGNITASGAVSNILNFNSAPSFANSLIQGSQLNNQWNTTFGIDNGNNIDDNPKFLNAAIGNLNLAPGSIAINAGKNNYYTDTDKGNGNFNIDKDLANNPRLIGGIIDMGAFENQCNTQAPTGYPVQSFNQGDTLNALVVYGQNIKWYATQSDAQTNTNSLANTTTITNNTTYYATQTIGSCESATAFAVLASNPTLGVNNDNSKKQLTVYPNPVKDILNLKTDEKIENIKIFSLDGKVVMSKTMNSNKQVEVQNLLQGVYIIQVTTENGVQNNRFIKQ